MIVAVVLLAVGADEVGLAEPALLDDRDDGVVVVVDVDPVAHVGAGAVELGLDAVEDAGDLARDELLDVLARAVVVRAVRQGGLEAEGADPGPHQQVGARLGGGVGARRVQRRRLGELGRVVELEVAVDLVGGDVVEALAVPAHRLERAGRSRRCWSRRRATGRRGELSLCDSAAKCTTTSWAATSSSTRSASVTEPLTKSTSPIDRVERGQVRGIGQGVEHGDLPVGTHLARPQDEVGADEAGAAGDEDLHGPRVYRGTALLAPNPLTPRAGCSRPIGPSLRRSARAESAHPYSAAAADSAAADRLERG